MKRKNDTTTPAPDVGARTETAPPATANDWPAPTAPVSLPILVELIDPNPEQPRAHFDEAELKELADNIIQLGLIQPIVVHPNGDRFTLHDGERRWRAHKLAGLTEIPAYIVPSGMDAKTLLLRAIVANDQRSDLSAIERAKGYQKLADEHGLSDADIAKQVGKSRSVVANTRRLLQLPADHQAQVANGELSERAALALLPFYQLPTDTQKKILDGYDGRKLAKPDSLTSDQIRSTITNGVRYNSEEITLIDLDQVFTGQNIHAPTCTGCDLHVKIGNSSRCLKSSCLKAKQDQARVAYLEQATAATGVAYIDPSQKYSYDDIGGFYGSSDSKIVQEALDKQCPNLRLQIKPNQWSTGPGPQQFDQCLYACLHYQRGCACKKVATAEADAAVQAKKQAAKQLTSQAVNHLTQVIREDPSRALRAILYSMGNQWDSSQKKALELKPDKVIVELARKLLTNGASPNEYRSIEDNKKNLNDWLTKVGLPSLDDEANKLADFDRRLIGIEEWVALPIRAKTPETIRENVTNLSKLAEEFPQLGKLKEGWPTLMARFDEAKSTLLMQLIELEAAQVAETTQPSDPGQAGAPQTDPCWTCGDGLVRYFIRLPGQQCSGSICEKCNHVYVGQEFHLNRPKPDLAVADVEAKLANIENWIRALPNPITPEHLEAINGNLTNLAKLTEITPHSKWPVEIMAGHDKAKINLLNLREQIEEVQKLPAAIKSIRATLTQITAWLGNPNNNDHPKKAVGRVLNNATNLAGDVYQLTYKHGETEELKQLLIDIEATETILRQRYNAADGPVSELEPTEAIA